MTVDTFADEFGFATFEETFTPERTAEVCIEQQHAHGKYWSTGWRTCRIVKVHPPTDNWPSGRFDVETTDGTVWTSCAPECVRQ